MLRNDAVDDLVELAGVFGVGRRLSPGGALNQVRLEARDGARDHFVSEHVGDLGRLGRERAHKPLRLLGYARAEFAQAGCQFGQAGRRLGAQAVRRFLADVGELVVDVLQPPAQLLHHPGHVALDQRGGPGAAFGQLILQGRQVALEAAHHPGRLGVQARHPCVPAAARAQHLARPADQRRGPAGVAHRTVDHQQVAGLRETDHGQDQHRHPPSP